MGVEVWGGYGWGKWEEVSKGHLGGTGRQVHTETTQIRRKGHLTQNVVGSKGWQASNRGTELTRNDLDRYTPRKWFSKSAEPRGPCSLVP